MTAEIRDQIELYVMGQYDGDVAALERAIAEDPALASHARESARLEQLLHEAGAAATFCAGCNDLVRGERCDACGAAVRPGGYAVERVIVANAHGRMYAATDADGQQVALKELAFVHAPSPAALAAFEREAKLLRALEHPAIPRFLASFEEGDGVHLRYYIAQELVAGAALDRLDDHWYSEAEVVALGKQVLAVLVYLQSLSPMVVHRDVKPANLLKRADGSIALVDLGAAHVQGATAGSTTIGTFGYMPIEQLAGEIDATTDVYALGMTLIHLLTRQEPWRITQSRTAINASAPLRAFLDRVTAADPRARFASAKEALGALETLGENRVVPSIATRPQRKATAVVAASIAIAAVGAAVGVYEVTSTTASSMHSSARAPEPTTLHVAVTPDEPAWLLIDGVPAGAVSNGDRISIAPGHHAMVLAHHSQSCTDYINVLAGQETDFGCTDDNGAGPAAAGGVLTISLEDEKQGWLLVDQQPVRQVKDDDAVEITQGAHHVVLVTEHDKSCRFDLVVAKRDHIPITCEDDEEAPPPAAVVRPRLHLATPIRWSARHEPFTGAMKQFAKSCKLNVIMPGALNDDVTFDLAAAPVPCDQALEAVLETHKLWYRYDPDARLVVILPRDNMEDDDDKPHGAPIPVGSVVTASFERIPVATVLASLATHATSKLNLVVSDNVTGTVTMFTDDVPWQTAFEAALEVTRLWYRYRNGVIQVMKSDEVDQTHDDDGTP